MKTLFRNANTAYQKGDYLKARGLYEKMIEAGADSAGVRYNLGNACYKLQDYAVAILNFEKALKDRPLDGNIRFNLKLSRMNILDKEQEAISNPFAASYSFLMDLVPLNFFVVLLLAGLIVLGTLFWFRFVHRSGSRMKQALVIAAWVCLGIFCLTALKTVYLEARNFAVVMEEEVSVTSGPGSNFSTLFNLHQGSRVRILEEAGGWYNIRFGQDFQGWLPVKDCEKI